VDIGGRVEKEIIDKKDSLASSYLMHIHRWSRIALLRWVCLFRCHEFNCLYMLSFGRSQEVARSPPLASYRMFA
jgi:hypothetical protein